MHHRLIYLALILVAGMLPGCSHGDAGSAKTASQREADLVFVTADAHKHLDPQKISWVADGRVAACLFETLVVYDAKDLSLQPGAAQSWSVSEDKLTYTFKLRQGAQWSNGDPVTAHDFVYAWRRALLPDMSADYTMLLFNIQGAQAFFNWRVDQLAEYAKAPTRQTPQQLYEQAQERFAQTVGIKAVDDDTLVATLARPTSYFLELCAFVTFMPNHRASLDAATLFDKDTGMIEVDAKVWSDPARLVCNGPYILKRYAFKQEMFMTANDRYWNRSKMGNRSILERVIPAIETSLLAYQSGEVDWLPQLSSASPLVADLVAQGRSDVHAVSMAGMYFYDFNCNPKLENGKPNPLADPRVRQAMSMGIDRKAIVSKVTRLNEPIARTFMPVDAVAGYAPPVEAGIGFDPKRGKQLLAQAGYADGASLKGLSILYNTANGHEQIAQAIKRMWQQYLGVSVALEGIEGKSFATRLKKQQYTICRASWFGDYRDPTTWLGKMATDDGNNDCRYSSKQYDLLLGKAADELDVQKRFDILRQAEAIMLQDSPMAMIYQYVNVYVYDPAKLKGLRPNPWGIWRLQEVVVQH